VRVLVVTNMYPPHHLGGYELSCRDVLRRWRAKGHDVAVLTTDFRVTDSTVGADDADIPVYRELEWYWRDHAFVRPWLGACLDIERRNQHRLADALDRVRPDVVSVWHLGGMSTGLLTTLVERRLPVVHVICDEWPIYAPMVDPWMRPWSRRPRLARAVGRLAGVPTTVPSLPETGRLTFVSAYLRDVVSRALDWADVEADVVPSGIDLTDFPITKGGRDWRGRLLCVGRVEPRKGFHVAVDALADLPGMTLDILGPVDDAYRDELLQRALDREVDDRLHLDVVPRTSLAERYRAADAVLFTSVWQEPFGLVPLEAMACGTPVVATGTGGSKEFCVDGVNCVIVPPEDPVALATAVRRLAGEPDLRRRLTEGGAQTASELTVERYAAHLERIHDMMQP
jgi:glycosyltransferase involved in cell wall biosynthesis